MLKTTEKYILCFASVILEFSDLFFTHYLIKLFFFKRKLWQVFYILESDLLATFEARYPSQRCLKAASSFIDRL